MTGEPSSSSWRAKRCLVTGAAGFGGTHLVRRLCELGASVIAWDWLAVTPEALGVCAGPTCQVVRADVRDVERLQLALRTHQIEYVFHLAAQPLVRVSNALPGPTLSTNVDGTIAVLEALRVVAPETKLVFASSGAAYGHFPSDAPLDEDAPSLVGNNIYGASKASADLIVRSYAAVYGLDTVCCRFMNTFGPGDTNFSRIIPGAIRLLLTKAPYDLGDVDDGTTELTYIFINDMTEAYLCAGEHIRRVSGRAFNFAADTPRSTMEVARKVSLAFDGVAREPLFRGSKRPSPMVKRLDTARATNELGWRPRTSFDDALKHTCAWYKEHWNTRPS